MQGLNDILRQAQEMQSNMRRLQEDLAGRTVEGSAGGGMVRVTATGRQEITAVTVDKACVNPDDVELLQDLVQAAVNDALRQSREMAEREMAALTGGLNLPGLTDGLKIPGL